MSKFETLFSVHAPWKVAWSPLDVSVKDLCNRPWGLLYAWEESITDKELHNIKSTDQMYTTSFNVTSDTDITLWNRR